MTFQNKGLDKVALIDYLTVSFYDFRIKKVGRNEYVVDDERYQDLLYILGYRGSMNNMQEYMPLHGFTNGYLINEYTRVSFGGEHVRSNGRYTLSVEMSGKACREFERYSGHDWVDYFDFIYTQDFFKVSRIDWAVDDFTANEITLSYIRNLVEKGLYSSLTRKGNFYFSWEKKADTIYTAGFTINIGVKGGNQLRIYDKKHEQLSTGYNCDHDIWNRYELEMHDDKATEVLQHYYLALKNGDDVDLKSFVQGLLFSFLDLKDENDKNLRIRRKKTDQKWVNFLNSISKIDIKVQPKHVPSYEVKKNWFSTDMRTSLSEILLAEDFVGFQELIYKMMLESIDKLKPKQIARVNDYLVTNGKARVTENSIKDVKDILLSILEVETEDLEND